MDILRPGYEKVKDIPDEQHRRRALEQEAVLTSIENLNGFPFVQKAIEDGMLSLHGLWTDIGEGSLYQYIEGEGFSPI
jgi:carbonic anhydrase